MSLKCERVKREINRKFDKKVEQQFLFNFNSNVSSKNKNKKNRYRLI